jgi:hypothetical protein
MTRMAKVHDPGWVRRLGVVVFYLVQPRIGRPLMVAAAIGSLWGLIFGTISSVLQLVLLALGGRARTAIG